MGAWWVRFQLWILALPDKVQSLSEKEKNRIPEEKREKRSKISKRIYLSCGGILLLCYIFWVMTGGSNPS